MYEVLLGIFLVVALLLIGVILIQQGKGADMGASFGAGSSNTVFGASGSGSFLTRMTTILVIIFFSVALAINYLVSHRDRSADVKDDVFSSTASEAPAAVVPAPVTSQEIPVLEASSAEVPAAEIPATEVPDTEVPANEIPAAEVKESEVPKP